MDADLVEIRVLGCLIEKQRTTPDQYPLSLNALRNACNQATSRDPVVDYDEPTIRAALERLSCKEWVRLASGPGSRAAKYRHLFDTALDLDPAELAVLAVLMLRGPQTTAEVGQRTERIHRFGPGEVEETLARLAERELVGVAERTPGRRGERWEQLIGSEQGQAQSLSLRNESLSLRSESPSPPSDDGPSLEERVTRLEEEVARLRALVDRD